MNSQSLTAKRIFLNAGLVIVSVLVFAAGAFAGAQDPAERQRALEPCDSNNLAAALPCWKVGGGEPRGRRRSFQAGLCASRQLGDEK